jgi:YfiH family protein
LLEVADHFFTTRQLRLRGDSESSDWSAAAGAIGVEPGRLIRLHQVHGRDVVVVRRDDPGARDRLVAPPAGPGGQGAKEGPAAQDGRDAHDGHYRRPNADIVISDDPTVALTVQVADCVPLLMADRRSGAVAAAHAGWRGTAARAAQAAVEALGREFGARPEDIVVAHGPSIGACCYEVGVDLVEAFEAAGFGSWIDRWFSRDAAATLRLDLWAANRDQLLESGVRAEDIHQAGLCTASHPEWFASYRRDGPGTGRIAAVIRSRGPRRPDPSPGSPAGRLPC